MFVDKERDRHIFIPERAVLRRQFHREGVAKRHSVGGADRPSPGIDARRAAIAPAAIGTAGEIDRIGHRQVIGLGEAGIGIFIGPLRIDRRRIRETDDPDDTLPDADAERERIRQVCLQDGPAIFLPLVRDALDTGIKPMQLFGRHSHPDAMDRGKFEGGAEMNLAEPAIGGNARAEFLDMQMAFRL
uniref:hypothetical protein n=1 Tax=Rhizobium laguerreae TaxID=1076926 RepID=UPI0021B0CB25|nr:hypothetical protein [Rhizobium laguerreae]